MDMDTPPLAAPVSDWRPPSGQIVLVLQGGGALGAFQAGVYVALHEAGVDPHWVVGTSIGAINGALIAGNPPERRLEKLHAFWDGIEHRSPWYSALTYPGFNGHNNNLNALTFGVRGFFQPSPTSWLGPHAVVGIERAAWYDTSPLRETLGALVDFDYLNAGPTRLTVGAVNARTGAMRYFDSRDEPVRLEHVMASGALPPAFPAVRIDGEPYWDGGIYSNTPAEVVFDDHPRRDSVIFAVHLWSPEGSEPGTIWDVAGRQKEIQYASRARSHARKLQQTHRLRHVIRELARRLPRDVAEEPEIKALTAWGCGTTMQIVRLLAPRLDREDHTKDIDFTRAGMRARFSAGYAQGRRAIEAGAWQQPVDPVEGVAIHEYA
jgi:NTE family protein